MFPIIMKFALVRLEREPNITLEFIVTSFNFMNYSLFTTGPIFPPLSISRTEALRNSANFQKSPEAHFSRQPTVFATTSRIVESRPAREKRGTNKGLLYLHRGFDVRYTRKFSSDKIPSTRQREAFASN